MSRARTVGLTVAILLVASLILALALTRPVSHGPARQLPTVPKSPAILESRVRDLKEVNYYPAADGWTYMWSRFDPTAIDRDFARIRALGANTVRIIIQPSVFGFPTVRPVMADHLSEVVGLAARHSLRVHLTLFDWWHQYTDVDGSEEWASSLLSRYRGDPRIAVVELQNEVYPQNPEVVAWVRTMLPYLPTVLPGTLRTVSIASVPPEVFALFTHELKNSPPDFWGYHYYGPPGDAYSLLSSIKALAAPRPLLVGETGYSTDGTPEDQAARDEAQAAYYRAVFTAAAALGLPTPAPWILNDFSPGAIPPSPTADDPAQYDFGLFQLNGTPKPAAAVVRTAFSGKLPTPWQRSTQMNLVLRSSLNGFFDGKCKASVSCRGSSMPKVLRARPPHDDGEERKICRLARSAPPGRLERDGAGELSELPRRAHAVTATRRQTSRPSPANLGILR